MKLLGVNLGFVGIILGGALAMGPGATTDAFACISERDCATPEEPAMPGSRSTDVAEGTSSGDSRSSGCPKSTVNVANEQQAAGQSLIVACSTLDCAAPQEERLKLVGEIQSAEASALRSLNRGPVACQNDDCATQEDLLRRKEMQIACISDRDCFTPDDEARIRSGSGFALASATTKAAASSALLVDDCLR